jgi:hypothetical protein
MKRLLGVIALLVLGGLVAIPAYADQRLTLTGFIDNHIRAFSNLSATDDDFNRNDDDEWHARTRGRISFNIAATEFSRAVIGFEFDQFWGDSSRNIAGSGSSPTRCVTSETGETCTLVNGGFDIGIDNFVFELRHLYVDFKVPQLPVRFRIGGFDLNATPLKNLTLLTMDVAAIEMLVDAHPQLKVLAYFSPSEEDFDEEFAARLGEDWFTGVTVQTIPMKNLNIDVLFAYQRLRGPNFSLSTIRIVPPNLANEKRWWAGVDARWKYGDLVIAPTFIYNGGEREFTNGGDSDISSFLVDVRAAYTFGPLTATLKFAYTPGNDATDNVNAPGTDVDYYQFIAIDTVHRSLDWFEILGFNTDTTSTPPFGFNDTRSMRSNLGFDQFGLIHGAARVDFKVLPPLIITGAVGFFATAADVGRPARLGAASAVNNPTYNYTGEDNYLGTEIDVWAQYTLFRGTDLDIYAAYAFIGDAFNLQDPGNNVREARDVIAGGARIIYRF